VPWVVSCLRAWPEFRPQKGEALESVGPVGRNNLLVGAPLSLISIAVLADPITVANPSFETLPPGGLPLSCGASCTYSVGPIPDWTLVGFAGQGQVIPGVGVPSFNTIPDGITIAFSNGGTISQTVGATAEAGVVYAMQVILA
jgi:hypothetical protein